MYVLHIHLKSKTRTVVISISIFQESTLPKLAENKKLVFDHSSKVLFRKAVSTINQRERGYHKYNDDADSSRDQKYHLVMVTASSEFPIWPQVQDVHIFSALLKPSTARTFFLLASRVERNAAVLFHSS